MVKTTNQIHMTLLPPINHLQSLGCFFKAKFDHFTHLFFPELREGKIPGTLSII